MKIKRDKLDELFSKFVRLKANGRCEYCGKFKDFKELQCSHFWGRRMQSVRYDPDNAIAVCFYCHRILTENPENHREFFRKRLGENGYKLLMVRAMTPKKPDQKLITLQLKELIKELEHDNK